MPSEYYPTAFSAEMLHQTDEYFLEDAHLMPAIAQGASVESRRRTRLFVKAYELRNYMPDEAPRIPEFDGDVAAYIAKSRETYATVSPEPHQLRITETSPVAQPTTVDEVIFKQYAEWRRVNLRPRILPVLRGRSVAFGFDGDRGTTYRDGLAPYMLGTIKAITAFSGMAADERFKEARRNILDNVVPELSTEVRESIEVGKINGLTLNTVERQLRALPYVWSTPNFFALSPKNQQEIVQAVGEEFLVFVKYATRYSDADILQQSLFPVMRRSAWDLEEVMKASSDPRSDFHNYTHNIEAFDARLAEIRAWGKERELSFDQQLLQLEIGEILPVTQPEETIRYNDLSRHVNNNLIRVAQVLYEVRYSGTPNLEANKQWNADTKDIVARLVAKSNGRISNVRYQAVDAAEYLRSMVKNWDPDETPVDTARAYVLMADIHSGSKTVPTAFEFAVYITRNPRGETGKIIKGVRGRSTGDQVIADEIQLSKERTRGGRVRSGTIVNKTNI